jgi:site-specific DNA-cytosine methylase
VLTDGLITSALTLGSLFDGITFPDGYTSIGHDGKTMSDSARYQMLGNSIVVNVLAYIMQNVAERHGGTPK